MGDAYLAESVLTRFLKSGEKAMTYEVLEKILAWPIKYSPEVEKSMRKLDRGIAEEIYDYLGEVQSLQNPCLRGKDLASNLSGLWRYRVWDERIPCEIRDNELIVLVVHLGKRDSVYDWKSEGRVKDANESSS